MAISPVADGEKSNPCGVVLFVVETVDLVGAVRLELDGAVFELVAAVGKAVLAHQLVVRGKLDADRRAGSQGGS